jgi:hypothetical protein
MGTARLLDNFLGCTLVRFPDLQRELPLEASWKARQLVGGSLASGLAGDLHQLFFTQLVHECC